MVKTLKIAAIAELTRLVSAGELRVYCIILLSVVASIVKVFYGLCVAHHRNVGIGDAA